MAATIDTAKLRPECSLDNVICDFSVDMLNVNVYMRRSGLWSHQFLGDGARCSRSRHLGRRGHAERVTIAAGDERLTGGRADRGRVEPMVLQAIGRDPLDVRGL